MSIDTPKRTVEGFAAKLIEDGTLVESAAQRLLAAVAATGHSFDTVVVELGLMREETLARALANYFGVEIAENFLSDIDREIVREIGLGFLGDRAALPLKSGDETALTLVVANPFDIDSLNMIRYLTDKEVVLRMAARSAILVSAGAIALETSAAVENGLTILEGASESDLERLRDFAQQAPIVRLVSRIAQIAADEHATDIHVEPFEHEVRIRIRVDGMLKIVETVPASYLPGISTRLKILANLDISERRLPQDGRIRIAVRGQEIDMRLSVIPAIHGETIVMRLLDRSVIALDLAQLGFDPDARAHLERVARLPNGIILITGPTGSGKTTTLYALMSILNDAAVKIFTVEDPVEYQLAGITQLQTNNAAGMTFARALRSVLRQDPDIILVGEIRDRETAEIAMQAALTGHLVLSTLHTNSAAGAVTRLRDMGIEDYLIGATVKGIVGQRLLRKTCLCQKLSMQAGCADCGGSGYSGRTVTYEIVEVTDPVARMISNGSPEEGILDELCRLGVKTMKEHARSLAECNVTTLAEIARAVRFEGIGST
jgi:general secretion pathway protein E